MAYGDTSDPVGRHPIFVVAPPCGGARRMAGLLAEAGRGANRPVEGSARHALEVPELKSRFSESVFVYVHRDPLGTLSESIAAWRSGTARRRPQPPSWIGPPWSFALVPGWEELRGRPLPEIVVEQWVRTMRTLLAALEALPTDRWCVTSFARARADPGSELRRLSGFLGIDVRPAHAAWPDGPAAPSPPAVPTELIPYLHRTQELAERAVGWIA